MRGGRESGERRPRAHELQDPTNEAAAVVLFDPERNIPRGLVNGWVDYVQTPWGRPVDQRVGTKSDTMRRRESHPAAGKLQVAADVVLMFPQLRDQCGLTETHLAVGESLVGQESKGPQDFSRLRDLAVLFPGQRARLQVDHHRQDELTQLVTESQRTPFTQFRPEDVRRFSHLTTTAALLHQLYPEAPSAVTAETWDWLQQLLDQLQAGALPDQPWEDKVQWLAQARLAAGARFDHSLFTIAMSGAVTAAQLSLVETTPNPTTARIAWNLTMLGAPELMVDEHSTVHWRPEVQREVVAPLPDRDI